MRKILQMLAAILVSAAACLSQAKAEETAVALDKLPKAVTDAVKKMFPKAELLKATQEQDGGEIEYEVTVKNDGKMLDITVEADGEIEALEKEIDLKDLPKAVTDALEKNYPKAVQKSVEAVYEVEDGKEELEYYEVQLKSVDNQEIEVKIKADGTLVTKTDDKKDEPKPQK